MLLLVLKSFARLPFSWQMGFARLITPLVMKLVKRRVRITEINLRKCFPSWSEAEVKAMTRKSFESFLLGAAEANAAWCMSSKRFSRIPFKINGLEYLKSLQAANQPVLLCSFHFHAVEITGRMFGESLPECALVYQKHPDPKFDSFMYDRRKLFAKEVFRRKELKKMLNWLKAGKVLWYAPDQDFGPIPSVFAPFFGVQTATLNAPAKMCMRTGAKLVPMFYARTDNGYEIHVLPALDNYPSGDDLKDATRLNALLEEYILKYPEQYLWQHRRFKSRPEGEKGFY